MWRAGLILLVLVYTTTTQGQSVFGGNVVSVTTIQSCTDLPALNAGQGARPTLIYQPSTEEPLESGDACSILGGEDTPFTNVILSVSADQVAGGDTLVFQLSGPSSGSAQPDGTDCYGTLSGADCSVFDGGRLLVSVETGNPVEVFDLLPWQTIPWASYWYQFPQINSTNFACDQCPPQASRGSVFVEYLDQVTEAFDRDGNSIGDAVLQAAPGPVGDTGIFSVCPTTSELDGEYQGAELYFPPTPEGGYPSLVSDPSKKPVLFAPTRSSFGGEGSAWVGGYSEQVGDTCTLNRIVPSPSLLFNARIDVSLETDASMSSGNSTASTGGGGDFIEVSSAQDGGLATDGTKQLLASMFDFSFVGSAAGQPMQGGIVTCGACSITDTTSSIGCANNLLSDYFCTGDDDGCGNLYSLSYTNNVYLTTPGGQKAVQEGCIFPVEYCRNIVADPSTTTNSANNPVKGSWAYINQQKLNLGTGGGFGRIDQKGDFYATDLSAAELMAMAGMSGNGIAGYQDTTIPEGRRFTAEVPCQIFLQAALALNAQNNCQATDGSCSESFAFGLPPDDNGAIPLYQLDNLKLIKTLPGTGSFSAKLSLSVPASYVGEVVTVSMGTILDQYMLCSVPASSSEGVISVTVRNTGTLAANYIASANFNSELVILPSGGFKTIDTDGEGDGTGDPTDTSTYTVQNSVPCTLGLEPNEVGTCLISFSYTGNQATDLKATVILTAGVVRSGGSPIVLGVAQTTCGITSSLDTGGLFGALSNGLLFGGGPRNNGEDEDNNRSLWRTLILIGLSVGVLLMIVYIYGFVLNIVYKEIKTLEYQSNLTDAYDKEDARAKSNSL